MWVARYKHPLLQVEGKRPTRSKKFNSNIEAGRVIVTEHQAFQIVLTWLWERHQACCSIAVDQPMWVKDALAECPACSSPHLQVCGFMETLQIEWKVSNNDTTAIAGGAVDSDCWSGEGTSETQSSEGATWSHQSAPTDWNHCQTKPTHPPLLPLNHTICISSKPNAVHQHGHSDKPCHSHLNA